MEGFLYHQIITGKKSPDSCPSEVNTVNVDHLLFIHMLYPCDLPIPGKGENIWDNFTHGGGFVANGDTGDVACNSYYQYQDDINMLQEMGVCRI